MHPLPLPGLGTGADVPSAERRDAVSADQLSNSADVGSAEYLYFIERERNQTMEGIGLIGQGTST